MKVYDIYHKDLKQNVWQGRRLERLKDAKDALEKIRKNKGEKYANKLEIRPRIIHYR